MTINLIRTRIPASFDSEQLTTARRSIEATMGFMRDSFLSLDSKCKARISVDDDLTFRLKFKDSRNIDFSLLMVQVWMTIDLYDNAPNRDDVVIPLIENTKYLKSSGKKFKIINS